MLKKQTILVAPLHWGLGHATRCIPIISALLKSNFDVLLASDGAALKLLQLEFPDLEYIKLPSYHIKYPKNGRYFKWKLLLELPRIQKVISEEKKIIKTLVLEGKIDGIISDNRFGVYNKKIPSVFLTHQLNVLSGTTSLISSKIHQRIIKKFDACWVPDEDTAIMNLSGKLGHMKRQIFPVTYIGILSRMRKIDIPIKNEILVILSGPEPQRTLFENQLKELFVKSEKSILMVQGIVEKEQKWSKWGNVKLVNYLKSEELEAEINASDIIISRSGYSSLMDLTAIGKKAFFIPTPGQYEQEYLAERLLNLGIAPSCSQKEFSIDKIDDIDSFKGLASLNYKPRDLSSLFSLFERK